MKKNSFSLHVRHWLNNISVHDPIERRIATLLQFVLLGVIAVILAAGLLNFVVSDISWLVILARYSIFLLILGIPLALLRYGYFRGSTQFIIGIFLFLESYAIMSAGLQQTDGTLSFYTLAIILAGLLLGRRALVFVSMLSAGVTGWNGVRAGIGSDDLSIALNFILLNGLIALFIDRFGVTLRTALNDALTREGELQNEIAERQRLEHELQEEHNFVLQVVNAMGHGLTVTDESGRFALVNPTYANLIGYAPEELIGKYPKDITVEEDRSALSEANTSRRLGKTTTYETRLRHKNGNSIPVLITGVPRLRDGEYNGAIASVTDLTEIKQAEAALRENESRLKSIIDNEPECVKVLDLDGRLLEMNPAGLAMIEADGLNQVSGQDVSTLVVPEHRIAFKDLTRTVAKGESGTLIFEIEGLKGTRRWLETHAVPLRDHSQHVKAILGITLDITERKRAEEVREKLIAELTAKNAELERFVYTVSHDLKSPLVTITGFLGYLEHDAISGNLDRFKNDVQRIDNAVTKMRRLLDDLLELSRIGRFINPSETASFEELISEAVRLVEGQIMKHNVTINVQPNLPMVFVDKPRLLEVLQNLIDNAIKYMGDQSEPYLEIGQRVENDGAPVFFVRDNGMGIAPEYHEKIFGLFNKLDAKSEGTGIGLALVKRIIEFHGGRIWVESEAGMGSTFLFTLPSSRAIV